MKVRVYDAEVGVNFYLFAFENYTNTERYLFCNFEDQVLTEESIPEKRRQGAKIISSEQLEELFLRSFLIGFRNYYYDDQLATYWLTGGKSRSTGRMKVFSDTLIGYDERQISSVIRSTDVARTWGFAGKQRAASLKHLEFSMRRPKVESLPFDPHKKITLKTLVDKVIPYVFDDVEPTKHMALLSKSKLKDRIKVSKEYGDNFVLYKSDDQLGSFLLLHRYAKKAKISLRRLENLGGSHWDQIAVKDVLFPYYKIRSQCAKEVHAYFNDMVLRPENDGTFNFKTSKRDFEIHGIKCRFGLGGVHGCIASGWYKSSKTWVIKTRDAKSMYPSLCFANKWAMHHLDAEIFSEEVRLIFEEKEQYPKGSYENSSRKLMINAATGNSNNIHSPLYDPRYFLGITVNGQLTQLDFADTVMYHIPEAILLMLNTDGMEVAIPRAKEELFDKIVKAWEKRCGLKLGGGDYEWMFIGNISNYVAMSTDNSVKRKGKSFLMYDDYVAENEFHKSPSATVIRKAINEYLVNGAPLEQTIANENDIHEFLYGWKFNVNSTCQEIHVGHKKKKMSYEGLISYFSKVSDKIKEVLSRIESQKDFTKTLLTQLSSLQNVAVALQDELSSVQEENIGVTVKVNTSRVIRGYVSKASCMYIQKIEKRKVKRPHTGLTVTSLISPKIRILMSIPKALDTTLRDVDRDWYVREASEIMKPILANTVIFTDA